MSDSAPMPEEMRPQLSATVADPAGHTPLGPHGRGGTEVQRIRCPHCHNPIQLADGHSEEVLCPGCGGTFRLRDSRPTTTLSGMQRLGRFQLIERVGLGAFGAVWRALDTQLHRTVALKIPHTGLLTSETELERFHREVRAAAQLRHPGIVTVHEVAMIEGLPVTVADFVHGVPLKDLLEVRRLPFREVATLVAQLAEALDYAHSQGVVHRDVKPANILVEYGPPDAVGTGDGPPLGRPLLTDFGLALRQGAEVTMTLEGQVLGTPAYMSPEQAAGQGHQADRRSDIYSLGVVLYELLCGELPFRGSPAMLKHQLLYEEPRQLRRIDPRVPRDLETICLKALAKAPARRYPTARAMADDLRRWLAGEPIQARPVGAAERAWVWARRRPAAAALLVVSAVAALALVGGVVSVLYSGRLKEALRQAEQAREGEAQAAHRAEEFHYFHRIGLAERCWWEDNVGRTRELLDECRPDEKRRWEWNYLDRLCRSELLRLEGHTDEVNSVAYSPDGRFLVSGSKDRTVRIWDASTGECLETLRGHTGTVWGVAVSPDGTKLASAAGANNQPGEVNVWAVDLPAGGGRPRTTPLFTRREPTTGEYCKVAFSPDGRRLAVASGSGSGKGQVKVFAVKDGRELLTLSGANEQGMTAVAFSPDGRRLASASGVPEANVHKGAAVVQVWDGDSGREVKRLECPGSSVFAVAFSPDGQLLAAAGTGKTVTLWDAATYREVRRLRGHRASIMSLAFRHDGRQLATAAEDQTVKVWDVAADGEPETLRGHTADVYAVAYSPEGGRLASAAMDRTVRVWDATSGQEARALRHPGAAPGVAFSSDGRWLATGCHDRAVRLWDLRQPASPPRVLGKHARAVWCVAFSPDGRWLASGAGDWADPSLPGEVRVWDVRTGAERFPPLKAYKGLVWSIAFSQDGKTMATAGGETHVPEDEVKLWDAATGRQLNAWRQPGGVVQVAFSRDGRRLACVATEQDLMKVWDVDTGQEVFHRSGEAHRPWCLAFSPDGRRLATGGADQAVRVWDAETGAAVATLRGHSSDVIRLAYSPDGRRLASAGYDQTVKLWDVATGQEVLTLRGHTNLVWGLAFSPDGRRIASASQDGTVRLWDATPLPERPGPAAPAAGK